MAEVPAPAPPIHTAGPNRRLAGSLGRLTSLDTELSDTRRTVKEPLTTVRAGLPAAALQFPAGAETRRLDADGRIKVAWSNSSTQGVGLSSVLGWEPGALDAVIVDGWMVLTQRPDLIGAKTRRQSIHGRFSVGASGVERIGLTAAHIDRLGANDFRTVLIVDSRSQQATINCRCVGAWPPCPTRTTPGTSSPNRGG